MGWITPWGIDLQLGRRPYSPHGEPGISAYVSTFWLLWQESCDCKRVLWSWGSAEWSQLSLLPWDSRSVHLHQGRGWVPHCKDLTTRGFRIPTDLISWRSLKGLVLHAWTNECKNLFYITHMHQINRKRKWIGVSLPPLLPRIQTTREPEMLLVLGAC